jgi:tetratricopeptide (TPR) repeat protein
VQAAPAHQDLLWRLRVHRHVRLGNFTAAMRLAEQRAPAEPKHAQARAEWQRLADYLTPEAKPKEVQPASNADKPVDPAADMMQASRQLFEALAQGDHDAAATPISKMLALSASLPTPWAQLAEAERQGNWKTAAHTLDGLLWRDPTIGDPVDDMLQLIELTHRGGDSARASSEAQALAKSLPHDDRPPLLLAQMAHEEQHTEDQIHWLSTVLERHPHARTHTLALAMALTDANRAPEALTALSTLATLDPEARDAEFLYVQGRAMGRTNPVAARTVLLASAKAKPQVKTYVLLSEVEQARGQLDDAGDAMRKAMALAPGQWDLKLKLARLLMPRKGYKEATAVLRQVLDDEPDATEAAELLGDVLHEQGELASAAETYVQASKAKDAPATLLLKLALLQMHELKDLPAAEKTLRRAVAKDPNMPEPYYYLGLALHDRNADADAKKQLQTYLRMSPDGAFVSDAKEAVLGL